MCDVQGPDVNRRTSVRTIPVTEAVGLVLAHDITEVRRDEFKGRAFKRGHIVRQEDICRLHMLGKEHLYALTVSGDEIHEDDAAYAICHALMGEGVRIGGEPREGKINIVSKRNGLLKVNKEALFQFNMLGDLMCATLHDNTVVKEDQVVAGTRAIPLVVKRKVVHEAVLISESVGKAIEVKEMRRPRTGVVITGNEVYSGRIRDVFAPVVVEKIQSVGGEIIGIHYAPDDEAHIADKLRVLLEMGADLLITTGGLSVDPDDVTRFAIRSLGITDLTYGSAVLPGAMFLIAYVKRPFTSNSELSPVMGIPACGMYHKITAFDLVLPRILAGEYLGRKELAEMGHGGLCLNCKVCRYPICPFGR